jgi:2-hydroxycyclohexanecarboxyl-CoA dehydrogenase
MGGLEDKIAIVTGAGQGIGQAIARKLAAEGATVAVTDLDEASAIQTADALPGAVAIRADVSDRQAVQAMADRVVQQFGRVDILVNNAGWDKASPFVDSDPADWDRAIAINLYGVLHTCKAVLPLMAARGGGAVVNLGSDAGRVGSSGEAVYSAAKGGVIAFTKSLAGRWRATRSGSTASAPARPIPRCSRRSRDRGCGRPSPRRSRSGGSASRPTSPTSSRSSPRTRRPSSPARPSASAAASR